MPETLDTFTMEPPSSCTAMTLWADWAHHSGARRLRLTMASTKRGEASAGGHVGRAPGVVDQDVEPAEVLDRLGDDPLGLGRLADVGRDEDRPLDVGLVAPAGHHVRPGRGERRHNARPRPPGSRPSPRPHAR